MSRTPRWALAWWMAGVVVASVPVMVSGGCVRPIQVTVSRQGAIQFTARLHAIWNRIRDIEKAACERNMVPVHKCLEADRLDLEVRAMFRELNAGLQTPGYEMDWTMMLRTLEAMGRVLDAIPFP